MHPLLERKKGVKPHFNEVLRDVEINHGKYLIKNVPHVVNDPMEIGLKYTVRASVDDKVTAIYRYMAQHGINEFDFNDYNQI